LPLVVGLFASILGLFWHTWALRCFSSSTTYYYQILVHIGTYWCIYCLYTRSLLSYLGLALFLNVYLTCSYSVPNTWALRCFSSSAAAVKLSKSTATTTCIQSTYRHMYIGAFRLQIGLPTTKIKEPKKKTCKRVQLTNTINETKKMADQPSSPPVGRPMYRCLSVNIGIYRYMSVNI
jgi:hypothetical protein